MARSPVTSIQDLDKATFEQHLATLLAEDTTPAALRTPPLRGILDLGMVNPGDPPMRKESNIFVDTHRKNRRRRRRSGESWGSGNGSPGERMREGTKEVDGGNAAQDKFADKREYVLRELRTTEELFVLDLKLILAAFVVPLCEHASLQTVQVQGVSYAVQILFTFQHRFLRALVRARSVRAVAKLFTSEAHGFEAYVEYCTKYHKLCDILDSLEADPGWTGFLSQVQTQIDEHSGRRRLALRDFLIKPVQRICKYPLFLKDLIKHTHRETDSTTYTELVNALDVVRGVCERIDEEQKRTEALKLRRVLIANYCDNPELPLSLVIKLGSIVLSGPLRITSHEDHHRGITAGGHGGPPRGFGCVLFRRFLIVLRPKKPATLVPKYWFPLHTMRLVDERNSEHIFSWRLQHGKSRQCMVFYARCQEEKEMWVARLRTAIEDAKARLRMRSGRTKCSLEDQSSGISECAQTFDSSAPPSPTGTSAMPSGSLANARAFWHQNSLVREDPVEKQFENMTTPDIIRVAIMAKLKHSPTSDLLRTASTSAPDRPTTRAVTIRRKPVGREIRTVASSGSSRASSSASEDTAVATSQTDPEFMLQTKAAASTDSQPATTAEASAGESQEYDAPNIKQQHHTSMPADGWPAIESPKSTMSGRLRSIFSSLSATKRRTHPGDVVSSDAFYSHADDHHQAVPDRVDTSSQDTAAESVQTATDGEEVGGLVKKNMAVNHVSSHVVA
ncbi:hypothetical protein FBU59_000918 [Linderina macrospora]|uniref:Uncharacterized protein n=1 Tax=Linderina macrospora TaxID=4868 RepID=A0ACC1JFH5_9FUNG|nr:hypothetical protein FBU59_000918 [Linderina macrospora]